MSTRLVYSPWQPRRANPGLRPQVSDGWYVLDGRYPSKVIGCVSRNYADRKWRIVCDNRPGSYPGGPNDHTYPSRDAAAQAEAVEIPWRK